MTYKKSKTKPTITYPELMELLVDIAIFTQKWTTPNIAQSVGISKQALQRQINKRKGTK